MSKPLRVWITEEYGFAEHLWIYPGTKREFITEWAEGANPFLTRFNGEMHDIDVTVYKQIPEPLLVIVFKDGEVLPEEKPSDFDAVIHYHEQDDTELKMGEIKISGLPGQTDVDAVIMLSLVADA
jgi:hypothetical protein